MTSRERLSGNVSADLEKKILDVMENCEDWLDPDFSISALSSTLQAVGESVGFKSVSNFIAAFKKTTGLTPSTYQKIARSNENTDYQEVKDF